MSQPHDGFESSATYRTPRWVKVLGIIIVFIVLAAGIMMLSGGEHSPSRHLPSSSVTQSVEAGGHVPPIQHSSQP